MDLVCVSHLRWDFVFQRPQHLLTRASRSRRVFYIEEPVISADPTPRMATRAVSPTLQVGVPHLPESSAADQRARLQADLIERYLDEQDIRDFVLWVYTPMAMAFTHRLAPATVVYDCMDELSAFAGAPPELVTHERALFARADVVFTGGHTLYEAKQACHPNVHAFPSSVDVAHFASARRTPCEPGDQQSIPHPRIGYYGVIDERMDYPLLDAVAAARPDWQFVLIGPTAKVDPATLPSRPNLHYLGGRGYDDLPAYMSGWDVAMLPFARNDATRYISPTKTPEYLAGGLPVVSTSIRDVVRPYGELGLARIADTPEAFVGAVEQALGSDLVVHRAAADRYLQHLSWDSSWAGMWNEVQRVTERRYSGV